MEQDIPQMLETHTGRYLLVNSISQRVRALQSGYKPLVPRGSNDLTSIAMEEFKEDKIRVRTLEDEEKEEEETEAEEEKATKAKSKTKAKAKTKTKK